MHYFCQSSHCNIVNAWVIPKTSWSSGYFLKYTVRHYIQPRRRQRSCETFTSIIQRQTKERVVRQGIEQGTKCWNIAQLLHREQKVDFIGISLWKCRTPNNYLQLSSQYMLYGAYPTFSQAILQWQGEYRPQWDSIIKEHVKLGHSQSSASSQYNIKQCDVPLWPFSSSSSYNAVT